MLAKKYNLSASQQAKLEALHASKKNEVAVTRSNGQRGQEMSQEQRQAMKTERDQYNAQLKAILTPEQYAQFEADRKNKKGGERHGKRNGGRKAGEKKETKS